MFRFHFGVRPHDLTENLINHPLFLSVMKHPEAYACLLDTILGDAARTLREVKVEEVILNHVGLRAIRLDAWATDMDGCRYDIEMQKDTVHDDIRRRSRYYQGLMDAPVLKAGRETKYRNLPDTVIIFITPEDIFHRDSAIYVFSVQCENVEGLLLGDGTKKIFLNTESRNGRAELVSMLQYLKDSRLENPEIIVRDEKLLRLDAIVQEVRQSEEWEEIRMTYMEYAMEQGERIGIRAFVMDALEERKSAEIIVEKLVRWFGLDTAQAKEYYEEFSKESMDDRAE